MLDPLIWYGQAFGRMALVGIPEARPSTSVRVPVLVPGLRAGSPVSGARAVVRQLPTGRARLGDSFSITLPS